MSTSNLTRNRSFRGGGGIYLKEKGVAGPLWLVGNADTLSFAIAEEKQTQRNFQSPGGGNIASESSITDVTGSLNGLSLNPRTLATALRGLIVEEAGAAVTSEAHTAYHDGFIKPAQVPDFDQAFTVTDATASTTYVSGTDYLVRNNGIFIDPDGAITDGQEIRLNYQSKATYKVESITKSAVDYELFFDGFNEADSGKAVTVTCHKVTFSPSQALSLITEDFGSLPMDFEVLADDSKDGTSESQYFVVQLEQ